MSRLRSLLPAIMIGLLALTPHDTLHAQRDVVVVRVASAGGSPIPGAEVRLTAVGSRSTAVGRTDALGGWAVALNPDSAYLILVTAAGYEPSQMRLGGERGAEVRVVLRPGAQLDTIRVQARRRPRPTEVQDVGGTGDLGLNATGLRGATDEGTLTGALAAFAGASTLGEGLSVFGLDPSENILLLGGMKFDGGALPRDLLAGIRASSLTTDPSRGAGAGATVAVSPEFGIAARTGSARLTVEEPRLQGAPPISSAASGRERAIRTGGSLQSRTSSQARYAAYADVSLRSRPAGSLLTLDDAALRAAGLDPAGVRGAISALRELPVVIDGRSDARELAVSTLLHAASPTTSARRYSGMLNAWLQQGAGVGGHSFATPSTMRQLHSGGVWAAISQSQYVQQSFLNTARVAVTVRADRSAAASDALGVALFGLGGASSDITGSPSLLFGGSPGPATFRQAASVTVRDELTWMSVSARHQWRATVDVRTDRSAVTANPSRSGLVSFQSVEDLQLGRAAGYSITRGRPQTDATLVSSVASVAVTSALQPSVVTTAALGAELTKYVGRLAHDPSLAALGVPPDSPAPTSVGFTPRIGVVWRYGSLPPRLKTVVEHEPRGTIRATIGLQHGAWSAGGLHRAIRSTDPLVDMLCVGPAAPHVDWHEVARGGAPACGPAGNYADRVTQWTVFERGFSAPRHLRGSVTWSLPLFRSIGFRLTSAVNDELSRSSTVDLNFRGIPEFFLATEGNRPVYSPAVAIDPRTGSTTAAGARREARLGRVHEVRSDGEARSVVTTARAGMDLPSGVAISLSGSMMAGTTTLRGFDGSTAGDPRMRESGPMTLDGWKQIVAAIDIPAGPIRVLGLLRAEGGRRFTPMVAGDVNGDGRHNDRAFVHPATAGHGIGAEMANLFSASRAAERCLASQTGTIAALNSCSAPWGTALDLRLELDSRSLGLPRRFHAAATMTNALAALDVLWHGAASARGWGQGAVTVDPVLLRVTSFDSSNRQFRYEVNRTFASPVARSVGTWRPFRLSLDLKWDLGTDPFAQRARFLLHGVGRQASAARRSEQQLVTTLTRNPPEAVTMLLRMADSLALTPDQRDSLANITSRFVGQSQTTWTPIAHELAQLPERYDVATVIELMDRGTAAQARITIDALRAARFLLTDEQWERVPDYRRFLFDARLVPRRW